jgi:hypothetical protein
MPTDLAEAQRAEDRLQHAAIACGELHEREALRGHRIFETDHRHLRVLRGAATGQRLTISEI